MLAMVAKVRDRSAIGSALRPHRRGWEFDSPRFHPLARVAAAAANENAGVAQQEELRSEKPRVPRSNRGAGTALAVLASFRVPALRGRTGVAQLVEHAVHTRAVIGSNPIPGTPQLAEIPMHWPAKSGCAGVVQSAEQPPRKRQVGGSMPSAGPADLGNETTGTTTTNGRVPAAATGTGCSPVGLRAFASSSLASPTGTTAGRLYCERVVKLVKTLVCNTKNAGPNPAALSGRKPSRGCCRALVEGLQRGAVYAETRVRVPYALLRKRQGNDTSDAFVRHAGVAQLVERRVANAQAAGSNPVSRSAMRGAGTGTLARHGRAGVAQLVERQPSKLDVAGSIPVSRSRSSSSSIVVI